MTETYDKENHWYGWNAGECPVHDMTLVEAMLADGTRIERSAGLFNWDYPDMPSTIIAFRITRLYREPKKPREWWLNKYDVVMDGPFVSTEDADSAAWEGRTERIHVREVLPEGDA